MAAQASTITGVAAGVPYLAVPPSTEPTASTPVVLAWHLLDPPRTEAAFAAALPLEGLDAWRVYLGLPLSGSRMPAGGLDELMRLGYEDAVLNVYGPISHQAVAEAGPAVAELRDRLGLGDRPLGMLGGSMGAMVAALVIAEGDLDVRAAVLVSPLVRLHTAVKELGKRYGVTYPWSEPSLAVARRLDLVARADEIARRGQPAVQLVVGAEDDGFVEPAEEVRAALASRYDDPGRVELVTIPGMGHPLADEPGIEPAPRNAHAAQVDAHAVRWLRRHLGAGG